MIDLVQVADGVKAGEESTSGNSGFLNNFVRMPAGVGHVTVRILPPSTKFGERKLLDGGLCQVTRTHRLNGKSIHCPRVWNNATKRWEGECPVCSYYSYLWKQSEGKGEEEQKALQAKARAIKPVERYYYSVIQRTVVDESGKTSTNVGPLILSIGKQLHQFILKSMVGDAALEEKGFGDVTDPKLGRDFKIIKKIKKSGDESYPEYNDSRFLEPSPLGTPDEVAKWTEAAFDLATLRKVRPVEELKHQLKVHLGLEKEVGKDNFDPSEYTPVYGGADVVKPAATVAPVATATAKAPVAVDEPMADDDFLTKLREQGLSSEE